MSIEIPMDEIIPQIRELAVAWGSHYNDEIWNKVKLGSDIQLITKDLMVSFLEWMKDNNIRLQVGYGSFFFAEDSSGNGCSAISLVSDFFKHLRTKK